MKVTNVKTLDSFFNRGESLRGKIETHSRHLTDTTAQAQLLGQSIKLRLNKKKFRYTRVSVFADRIELVIVAGVDNPEMVPVRSLDRMVQAKFTEVETKAQTITWRLSKLRTAIPNGSNLGVVMDPEKFKLHLIDPDGVLKTVPTTMTKDIYRSIAKFNTRLQQLNLLLNDPVALSAMIHMCYSSLASQVLVSKEDVTKYTVFDDEGIPDVGLPHNIASSLVGEARLAYNAIQSLTTRIKMISNDLPILLAKRTEIMQQVYEIQSKAYDLARSEAKMSMIDASLVKHTQNDFITLRTFQPIFFRLATLLNAFAAPGGRLREAERSRNRSDSKTSRCVIKRTPASAAGHYRSVQSANHPVESANQRLWPPNQRA
eukprot:c16156_g1_i1.p2 GENE.c16156_g1_i1~~c16156_g1_i1.p2  ORF type:complete len:373 (+),score=82.81 c16156_g1_i1:40-1158(+)